MLRIIGCLVALLALTACGPLVVEPSQVAGVAGQTQTMVCRSTNSVTCTNFQVVLVKYDPNNPLLRDVKEGRAPPYMTAHEVHAQVLAGKIARYTARTEIDVYIWAPRPGVDLGQLSIYDNLHGTRVRRSVSLDTSTIPPPFIKGRGYPDHQFKMIASGQTVILSLPKAYFTPGTEILLCAPGLPSIVPSQERGEGIWYTRGTLPSYVGGTQPLSTFFMTE